MLVFFKEILKGEILTINYAINYKLKPFKIFKGNNVKRLLWLHNILQTDRC